MSIDDQKMRALAQKFIARTMAESNELRRSQGLSRAEVLNIVHRISGSAGLFGFHLLGERAEAVEMAIADGLPHLPALDALLEAIDAQLD